MPQTRRPYLKVHRRQRGDGSSREYFYNSQTGDAYGSDRAIAEARFAEWTGAQVPGRAIGGPTLDDAIVAYYATKIGKHAYQTRKPRTREIYRLYLEQLRARMGKVPLIGIDKRVVEKIRDNLAAHPSKCNQTLAVLQIVLNHAIRSGTIKGSNPAVDVERVECSPRSAVWTSQDIERFLASARPSLRLAALLLLYTAQRPSDVLAMTKGQVSERGGRLYISMRQEKTGALIDVPVHAALDPALRARLVDPAGGLMLVPSPTGLMWSRRNFSRGWDQARRAAGLPALQRRDLRRTAVVNMAVAGLPVPQIAAITGHSLKSVEDILRVYLPRRTEVALAGIAAWEAAAPPNLDNVVRLAATRGRRV